MWTLNNNSTGYPWEQLNRHTQELALLQVKQKDFSISIHAQHHPWFYGLDIDQLKQDLRKLGFTDNEIKHQMHFEHWSFMTPNGALNPYLEFDTTLPIAERIAFHKDLAILQQELNHGKNIFAKRPHTLPEVTRIKQMQSPTAPVQNVGPSHTAQPSSIPRCPTCSSTNIRKITAGEKAGGFALFGVFSRKVQKQFHCNSCGYEW